MRDRSGGLVVGARRETAPHTGQRSPRRPYTVFMLYDHEYRLPVIRCRGNDVDKSPIRKQRAGCQVRRAVLPMASCTRSGDK